MNREIKFRGKRVDTGEWVYGYYYACVEHGDNGGVEHLYMETTILLHYISDIEGNLYFVYPETVGQYTGLTDKNGKEIYEGDKFTITQYDYENGYENSWGDMMPKDVVVEKEMTMDFAYTYEIFGEFDNDSIEIIGTIFDKEEI